MIISSPSATGLPQVAAKHLSKVPVAGSLIQILNDLDFELSFLWKMVFFDISFLLEPTETTGHVLAWWYHWDGSLQTRLTLVVEYRFPLSTHFEVRLLVTLR